MQVTNPAASQKDFINSLNLKNNQMNAPFKVGQKVVRIGRTVPGICEHGKIYTVKKLYQCECGDWKICCCEFPPAKGVIIGSCSCGKYPVDIHEFYGVCKKFAPIEESKERIRYVAVSETLREQAVETAAIETN